MAWQEDMREVLRVLIDDMVTPYRNTDANLERVLAVACMQVLQELSFSQVFTVNIAQGTISPDPTLAASKEESLVNLVCLKAACILDRAAASKTSSKAFLIKDGNSTYDNRSISQDKIKLLDKNWCAEYAKAKEEHERLYSTTGAVTGKMVLTPFRLYARSFYYRD